MTIFWCGDDGTLSELNHGSVYADSQWVGRIYTIFRPFHVGFGFSTAAKFDALGVDPDKPAFGCVPFFDSDLHH